MPTMTREERRAWQAAWEAFPAGSREGPEERGAHYAGWLAGRRWACQAALAARAELMAENERLTMHLEITTSERDHETQRRLEAETEVDRLRQTIADALDDLERRDELGARDRLRAVLSETGPAGPARGADDER